MAANFYQQYSLLKSFVQAFCVALITKLLMKL